MKNRDLSTEQAVFLPDKATLLMLWLSASFSAVTYLLSNSISLTSPMHKLMWNASISKWMSTDESECLSKLLMMRRCRRKLELATNPTQHTCGCDASLNLITEIDKILISLHVNVRRWHRFMWFHQSDPKLVFDCLYCTQLWIIRVAHSPFACLLDKMTFTQN
jgi:hypothetical protein